MENTSKTSIISVEGNGFIEAEANILKIGITVYEITESIKKSQEEVNKVVKKIITILEENNVNKNNIHTTSIEFRPNYTWENNSNKYTGQRVEQVLICIIEDINKNINMVINILDKITIDNNSIRLELDFGIKENREMVIKCRELAYQDGYEKAKKYAELAGLKIVKALRISENESSSRYSDRYDKAFDLIELSGIPTQLPIGKVEKSMSLYIEFIAK